jgi:hypothetical protein
VAFTHKWQPRQFRAASRSFVKVGFGGMKSAADPVATELLARDSVIYHTSQPDRQRKCSGSLAVPKFPGYS